MKLAILGATGSIGTQALDVASRMEDISITALTANSDGRSLAGLCERFRPAYSCLTGIPSAEAPDIITEIRADTEGLLRACEQDDPDTVLISVTGIAGLRPLVKCLREGRRVALANKEAMVCGGPLIRALMDETGTPVLPVDSELSAIFQCIGNNSMRDVASVWLTASGGPLYGLTAEEIACAPVSRVLAHPNWDMGRKITVDSASLVNKGLEMMETRWLFDIPFENIKPVIHRQSIVHSMVAFRDGCVIAQLAAPDMRLPIQYALTYPEHCDAIVETLDFSSIPDLTFCAPDEERFPCLRLCREASMTHAGQIALNAANELAVYEYLRGAIAFGGIYDVIARALEAFAHRSVSTFDDIFALDEEVRAFCLGTGTGR